WNFGPSDSSPLTVSEIAHRFVQSWGRGQVIEAETTAGPHEARLLQLDSSKARAELSWQPLLTTRERLDWTVDWYKTWQQSPDEVWNITSQQIQNMETKIRSTPLFGQVWNGQDPSTKNWRAA
ncbi:MAG: hypothetical protein KDA84_23725, partial [Planctomycetaceae bacterium]|nr:hypothetical protein [Planctomycetaceae bacterium]